MYNNVLPNLLRRCRFPALPAGVGVVLMLVSCLAPPFAFGSQLSPSSIPGLPPLPFSFQEGEPEVHSKGPFFFKFTFNVTLSNLSPKVEEARVFCIAMGQPLGAGGPFFTGAAHSAPLDLGAQGESAVVLMREGYGDPAAAQNWVCVLAFRVEGASPTQGDQDAMSWFEMFELPELKGFFGARSTEECGSPTMDGPKDVLCAPGAQTSFYGEIPWPKKYSAPPVSQP